MYFHFIFFYVFHETTQRVKLYVYAFKNCYNIEFYQYISISIVLFINALYIAVFKNQNTNNKRKDKNNESINQCT